MKISPILKSLIFIKLAHNTERQRAFVTQMASDEAFEYVSIFDGQTKSVPKVGFEDGFFQCSQLRIRSGL